MKPSQRIQEIINLSYPRGNQPDAKDYVDSILQYLDEQFEKKRWENRWGKEQKDESTR